MNILKHVRPKISLTGEPAYVHRGTSPADMTIDRVQLCYQLHMKKLEGGFAGVYTNIILLLYFKMQVSIIRFRFMTKQGQ